MTCTFDLVFFKCYGDHRDLHVLTHSSPTRRSSDLLARIVTDGGYRGHNAPKEKRFGVYVAGQNAASLPPSSAPSGAARPSSRRSEEHTSEPQSLMRISYAVFCLKTKKTIAKSHKPLSSRYT